MAKSRASLNQLDLTDVAVAWAAFEEINQVDVEIALVMAKRGPHRELVLKAKAVDRKDECVDQKRSVLANANSWVMNHKSMDAAVFHLLYTLDGLIAEQEFINAAKKEA